jgi:tRNA nucleotidyltransferase (CCA-adding enzyme)
MNTQVVAIERDANVGEAVAVLTEHHIGGAPVVDEHRKVLGMVSELVLIDFIFDPSMRHAPVTSYMSPNVHTVKPTDSLAKAAQLFALYSFRQLPVVDNDRLVGILTRRDLMNYALQTGQSIADPLAEILPALTPCHDMPLPPQPHEFEFA